MRAVTTDPSPANAFSRVLQGQDSSTSRVLFAESNESDSCARPSQWPPSLIIDENDKIDPVTVSQRYSGMDKVSFGRPTESYFTDLLSGFGSSNGQSQPEGKFNLLNRWSTPPSNLSLNLMGPTMKGAYGEQPHEKWLMPPPLTSYLQITKSPLAQQSEVRKPEDGNCKIFGVPFGNKVASEAHQTVKLQQFPSFESGLMSEQSTGLKVIGNPPAGKEIEEQYQNSQSQPKVHLGVSPRSCTKVLVVLYAVVATLIAFLMGIYFIYK